MNELSPNTSAELVAKIARLVEERGWNQEDFARIAKLNRQTARQILQANGDRKLRNSTIDRCCKALDLTGNELRSLPLERLLPRMRSDHPSHESSALHRLYEQATQPELLAWLERNPDRSRQLTSEDIDELLSLQGTGGPLTTFGVEHFVGVIERKRRLIRQIHAIAGTEYMDVLEKIVSLLFDKIQPYRDKP